MSTLTDQEREVIRANVFSETGIPLSREDPIFALVEIIKASDEVVLERVSTACDRATQSLTQAAEHLEERSGQLESMVDSYIQSRIEAANAAIDSETKKLKERTEIEIQALSSKLQNDLMQELKAYTEAQCIRPLQEALAFIPHRSWLENLWTLTACLAIGFATGFLYFDGSIHSKPTQTADSLKH
jgi:vacuolar-type H+-ATPase subunit H